MSIGLSPVLVCPQKQPENPNLAKKGCPRQQEAKGKPHN